MLQAHGLRGGFFIVNCNFILECASGKIPHRRNSLEPDGWAVAAMNGPCGIRLCRNAGRYSTGGMGCGH